MFEKFVDCTEFGLIKFEFIWDLFWTDENVTFVTLTNFCEFGEFTNSLVWFIIFVVVVVEVVEAEATEVVVWIFDWETFEIKLLLWLL